MDKIIEKYDSNNNEIYYKDSDGYEEWKEYDENNNLIHYKDSYGYEYWKEYDSNNNVIHYKNSYGDEYWYSYDENNNKMAFTSYNSYKTFLSKNNIKELIKEIINTNALIKNMCEDDNSCFSKIILHTIMNSDNIIEDMFIMLASQSNIYDKLLNNIAQYGSKELIEKCNKDIHDIFK